MADDDRWANLPLSENIEDRRTSIDAPWKEALLPAHYDTRLFHVESGTKTGGRRIVTHQFPKKDQPYSEDMGRVATEFTVRGYIISFMRDTGIPLYMRDYRIARDQLTTRLDQRGFALLQLPTQEPMLVVCSAYRLSEQNQLGGYCEIDMTFVEYGAPPFRDLPDTEQQLREKSFELRDQIAAALTPKPIGTITRGSPWPH